MKTTCANCYNEFECDNRKFNFNTKQGYRIFCSKECWELNREKGVRGNCANCGKEIKTRPSQIERSKTGNLYCSRSCAVSNNNRLFKQGEDHPNYTTGKGSYRNRTLRIKDKCEDCGIEDKRVLEVHHLDKNRQNNTPENLVVLCANCHLIRHRE